MSDATKPDLPKPSLVGEVTPPRSIGGRQYRSASCHGNGTLTTKQEAFCQGVVFGGLSNSDAYRGAYNTSRMQPASIWRKAGEVASNVRVAARIKELRGEASQDLQEMRMFALFCLQREMEMAKSSSARIRAAKILLHACGPPCQPKPDQGLSRADLEQRLRTLLSSATDDGHQTTDDGHPLDG
jgi:hypothetical protein